MAKYVKTTRGLIPMEDYLEIAAMKYGYDSYEQLKNDGLGIDVSENDIIEK